MANRIIDLPQTKGSFEFAGKVTGTQRSGYYNESTTKNGSTRRVLSFGIQTNKDDTFYVELAGMPRDNVSFFRRADKDKGIEKDTKKIPWKDRFNYVAPEGYEQIGVRVGVTKVQNEKGKMVNDNKVMTEYDATEFISQNLHDGDDVYVRGNIEYSTYNGKHLTKFVPTQVSLSSKEIDFAAEDFEEKAYFTQTIVYTGGHKDTESDDIILDAKIVGYSSVEDAEFYINPKMNEQVAVMAKSLKKYVKPYTSFECHGPIIAQKKVEEVEEEDIWGCANKMKKQSSPVVRKLYLDGIEAATFDPDPKNRDAEPTYTEDNISEAIAKIRNAAQAKKDFDGKAAEEDAASWWGGQNKSTATPSANEEEEDWG